MWIGVADAASGASIDNATFSYNYQNYGSGWYWVAVGANTWVYVYANGYNNGSAYTDSYDSFRIYLTRPTSGGGGKK